MNGILASKKSGQYNLIESADKVLDWSPYKKRHCIDNINIYTYKKTLAINDPMSTHLARYLALIAYGRMYIHKMVLKYNINIHSINTDGFITDSPLPLSLLGKEPGELKLIMEKKEC